MHQFMSMNVIPRYLTCWDKTGQLMDIQYSYNEGISFCAAGVIYNLDWNVKHFPKTHNKYVKIHAIQNLSRLK